MNKYIKAELYRVYRRIPRLIMLGLILLAMIDIFRPGSNKDSTIIELVDLLEQALKYAPIYIGFVEMIFVFGDDFAGKTAQIAIGTGIRRSQVIFAKWFEALIVVAIDTAAVVVVALVLSVIKTHTLPAKLLVDILAHMVVSVLSTGAFMALVFPIMFMMQGITVAFLIYILLSSGAINKIIGLIGNAKFLVKLNIANYTLSNCLNVFRSRMILGSFQIESVLGIVLYVGLALWFTCFLYKKRELEF